MTTKYNLDRSRSTLDDEMTVIILEQAMEEAVIARRAALNNDCSQERVWESKAHLIADMLRLDFGTVWEEIDSHLAA